jgi:hypothetical protein
VGRGGTRWVSGRGGRRARGKAAPKAERPSPNLSGKKKRLPRVRAKRKKRRDPKVHIKPGWDFN